jgi:hypothetical protein
MHWLRSMQDVRSPAPQACKNAWHTPPSEETRWAHLLQELPLPWPWPAPLAGVNADATAKIATNMATAKYLTLLLISHSPPCSYGVRTTLGMSG